MRKLPAIFLAFTVLFSCSKSDDAKSPSPSPTFVDPSDPNKVSKEMGLANTDWIPKQGVAPSSQGGLIQTSTLDNDTVGAFSGLPLTLDIDVDSTSGNANSILFEIEGANTHYEIPADPDGKKGLIAKQGNPNAGINSGFLFLFNIPSSIQPGLFCVRYAVTNSIGQVSNYVTVCIVLGPGAGAGSGNLTNKIWERAKLEGYNSADSLLYTDDGTWSNTDTFWCQQTSGFELWTEETINKNYEEFFLDGRVQYSGKARTKFFTGGNDCGDLIYTEDSSTYQLEAQWSYNQNTNIITVRQNGFYTGGGNFVIPEPSEREIIENTPTSIKFKSIDSGQGDYFIWYYVPKL